MRHFTSSYEAEGSSVLWYTDPQRRIVPSRRQPNSASARKLRIFVREPLGIKTWLFDPLLEGLDVKSSQKKCPLGSSQYEVPIYIECYAASDISASMATPKKASLGLVAVHTL
jgi:hypothetical protein